MSPEQWEAIKANAEAVTRERDRLRTLLFEALDFVPAGHPTWLASRRALGLTTDEPA